ncbi:hypothetical protein CN918_25975 [Priestia megaterium]|nr:hypothetical protein CN918_25975 [Priestia megaterium]
MSNTPKTKEEMCEALVSTYPHFSYQELIKRNESQIFTLYNACLDEDGKLSSYKIEDISERK